MDKPARKRLLNVLRIVLSIVFIAWALKGVSLHDRVAITAPEAEDGVHVYRLLAEDSQSVTVRRPDGTEQSFPRTSVAADEDGSERIERGLATALGQSNLSIIGLAFLVFAPVPFIQSLRFKLMLAAQEIHLTYWECVKLSFGGNFLNFVFLLGTTAGDVFKAYYTALHTDRKTEAVTTILLDRFVGLFGLLVVAIATMFVGSDNPLLGDLRVFALLIIGVFALGAIVVTSRRLRALAPTRFLSRLPGWEQIRRAHGATDRLLRHKPMLAGSVLLAIVLQFIAVGAGVICAYGLHMDFTGSKRWDYFAYIGSGHVVAAVPITPQGLGTMEVAYKKFFLGEYGSLSQLLCLALWLRLLQFAWSLPGALVTLLGSVRPRELQLDPETGSLSP